MKKMPTNDVDEAYAIEHTNRPGLTHTYCTITRVRDLPTEQVDVEKHVLAVVEVELVGFDHDFSDRVCGRT